MNESSLKERMKSELLAVYERLAPEQCVDLLAAALRIGKKKETFPAPPENSIEAVKIFRDFVRKHREQLDHSCNPEVIALNLPHFREVAKTEGGEAGIVTVPRFFQYSPLLRCRERKAIRSRLWGKTVRCWIFQSTPFDNSCGGQNETH